MKQRKASKAAATTAATAAAAASAVGDTARQVDEEAILYRRVLPPEVCARLIRMSREREFSLELEPVDDRPVYQIDLVQHGWVADHEMMSVVGPLYDAEMKPILAELPWLRGAAFTLDFAFCKRYRPQERTHLGIHLDSSFFTFNVLLSDPAEFQGGQIYIFTPQETQKRFTRHESMTTEQKDAWVLGRASTQTLPVVSGYGCGVPRDPKSTYQPGCFVCAGMLTLSSG